MEFRWAKEGGGERNEHENTYTLKCQRGLRDLALEDQKEIFNIGTAFRVLDLQKRLAQAQENVQKFEAKYGTTLDMLESEELPEDASYEMHEDYVVMALLGQGA